MKDKPDFPPSGFYELLIAQKEFQNSTVENKILEHRQWACKVSRSFPTSMYNKKDIIKTLIIKTHIIRI